MIEEALEHYQNGNYPAAEVLYRKMLEEEPDNPEVLFMLSLVRQGQDDLEEPVELLSHALRIQPGNPSLHYSLGSVQLNACSTARRSAFWAMGNQRVGSSHSGSVLAMVC